MAFEKADIENRIDVKTFVDRFYGNVNVDPLLAPIFAHVDWSQHLPIMYNFWSSILLGDQSYNGNPLQHHLKLPIDASHFNRWLDLFTQTIDEHFTGPKAEEAKMRAGAIAGIFLVKINQLKNG